ncbi:hypothetical protein EEO77_22025 [Salmonella enterica]|nr:hypothetical protein [Salmonella enterica]
MVYCNDDRYHTRYDFICFFIIISFAGFPAVRSGFCENRIFFQHHSPQQPDDTRCATQSTAYSSICCVSPLSRDRPVSTGKGRCGYSLAVVHFRKRLNHAKPGSGRYREKVI